MNRGRFYLELAGSDCCLIDHVIDVGSDEASGVPGQLHRVHIRVAEDLGDVEIEQLLPRIQVRRINGDLDVETTRADQSLVQIVTLVRRPDHDHA